MTRGRKRRGPRAVRAPKKIKAPPKESELNDKQYGKGAKLLRLCGWRDGEGLGKRSQGISLDALLTSFEDATGDARGLGHRRAAVAAAWAAPAEETDEPRAPEPIGDWGAPAAAADGWGAAAAAPVGRGAAPAPAPDGWGAPAASSSGGGWGAPAAPPDRRGESTASSGGGWGSSEPSSGGWGAAPASRGSGWGAPETRGGRARDASGGGRGRHASPASRGWGS